VKVPIATLIILCCAALHAAAIDATIITVEGEEQATQILEINSAAVKTATATLPLTSIASINFNAAAEASSAKGVLHLRNGDQIVADVVSGNDTKLKIKSAALGEIEIDTKFINAFMFKNKDGPTADVIDDFLKAAPPKEDLLLLPKGDTASGFLEKFTEKDLSFNGGGQSRLYAIEKIAGLRLAMLDAYAPPGDLRAKLVLRDGSLLTGKLKALSEKSLQIDALDGKQWDVAALALRSILFTGGKLNYLSDLKPSAVEEKPYVGGAPVTFRWRKDRSAAGGKLRIAEKEYERGIGAHSYSKLAFNLNGQYTKFLTDVGMDASSSGGICAWQIIVDGATLKSGTAKAGAKAEPISIVLKPGAKSLELICDYGADDDDAGDHLDWANARLIKP